MSVDDLLRRVGLIRLDGGSGIERHRENGAAEELMIDECSIEKGIEPCHILIASEAENEVRDHAAIAKGKDIARRVEDGIFRLRVTERCSNLGQSTSVRKRRRRRRNALRQGKKRNDELVTIDKMIETCTRSI